MTAEVSAGRELDAEVAVRVMGWQRRHADPNTEQFVVVPPGWTDWSTFYWWGRNIYHLVPLYSTDLAAAGQVIEHFVTQGAYVLIAGPANGVVHDGWRCKITPNRDLNAAVEAWGETIPIAICRAALAALVRRD